MLVVDPPEPTIRGRELGDGLRKDMKQAGLTGLQVATMLNWSESFVSLVLSGRRGTSEIDIAAFLGVCRVKGPERERLPALCREQDTPGWLQQYGSRLPKQLRTLIDHENKAVTISDFQPLVVPGLLQTGEYARALSQETGNVPPGEIDDRVATRLARQSLVRDSKDPDGPALTSPPQPGEPSSAPSPTDPFRARGGYRPLSALQSHFKAG